MPIDPALLQTVRAAAAALAEHERQTVLARAEYHTAIRRLHLGGAPLREVAAALSLSHQRVQQIVDATGGSWWRRTWGARNAKPGAACTWCGKPANEVDKLVAGPNVFLCDGCAGEAMNALRSRASTGTHHVSRKGGRDRCSFCRRTAAGGREVVVSDAANVCGDCLKTCLELMQTGPSVPVT